MPRTPSPTRVPGPLSHALAVPPSRPQKGPEFSTDPLLHPQIETPPVEFWARPVGLHRSSRVPEDRAGRHARIVEGPARGRTRKSGRNW